MVDIVCSSNCDTYAYVGSCGIQNSNQKWQRPSKSIWYWLLSIYYDCGWTVPKKAKKIIYNFNENDWTELYPEMIMLMFMKRGSVIWNI